MFFSEELLLLVPIIEISIRIGLGLCLNNEGGDESSYITPTKDLTNLLFCLPSIIKCSWARIFSVTPYLELENHVVYVYYYIQIIGMIIQFRNNLSDVMVPLIPIVAILIGGQMSQYIQIISYWVTLFSVVHGIETIVLPVKHNYPRSTRLFNRIMWWSAIGTFLYQSIVWVREDKNNVSKIWREVLPMVIYIIFTYWGSFSEYRLMRPLDQSRKYHIQEQYILKGSTSSLLLYDGTPPPPPIVVLPPPPSSLAVVTVATEPSRPTKKKRKTVLVKEENTTEQIQ